MAGIEIITRTERRRRWSRADRTLTNWRGSRLALAA